MNFGVVVSCSGETSSVLLRLVAKRRHQPWLTVALV